MQTYLNQPRAMTGEFREIKWYKNPVMWMKFQVKKLIWKLTPSPMTRVLMVLVALLLGMGYGWYKTFTANYDIRFTSPIVKKGTESYTEVWNSRALCLSEQTPVVNDLGHVSAGNKKALDEWNTPINE